ncbi:MAG TPA: hypothetical protein VJR94_00020 [Candidatus Nitrosocosmicus sp.]|nr:hypothetical protein [Candidatus Nitrosocosmicus sp.]
MNNTLVLLTSFVLLFSTISIASVNAQNESQSQNQSAPIAHVGNNTEVPFKNQSQNLQPENQTKPDSVTDEVVQ